jgi:hypothetical protein
MGGREKKYYFILRDRIQDVRMPSSYAKFVCRRDRYSRINFFEEHDTPDESIRKKMKYHRKYYEVLKNMIKNIYKYIIEVNK